MTHALTIGRNGLLNAFCFARDARRRRKETPTEPGVPEHASVHTDARMGADGSKTPRGGLVRCPNCNALIDSTELAGMPLKTCPRCHLPIEKVHLA